VVDDQATRVVEELSLDEKVALTAGLDGFRAELPGIAVGGLRLSDGFNGVDGRRYDERDPSLCTPCASAVAATWDPELARALGGTIGREARRKGVDVVLGPMLNLPRSPLGGRGFECFSEEPFLAGAIGAAWIAGVQAEGVAATPKHLVCNDLETSRRSVDVVVDEVTLHELYLRPFEMATAAGAWALMPAYNAVNGELCHDAEWLLRTLLKGAWAWDGAVVSDWFGVVDGVRSASAGIDLEMPGPARHFGRRLTTAVERGELAESVIDEMAVRLARLAARVGRMRSAPARSSDPGPREAERALLRDAATAGFVLLRNRGGLLPLVPGTVSRLAVLGPAAAMPAIQGGGASAVTPERCVTPLDGLRARYGADVVRHAEGCGHRMTRRALRGLTARTPDGSPGVAVAYVPHTGNAVVERRNSTSLVWTEGLPGIAGEGTVRMTGMLTASATGRYEFGLCASHSAMLRIRGTEICAFRPEHPPDDPWAALYSEDEATGAVELRAGETLALEVEMHVEPAPFHLLAFGCHPPEPADALERAIAEAAAADAVVLAVGTTEELERESGDRADLRLPGRQDELIRRVLEVNERVVVVVNAGGPVALSAAAEAPALLYAWFPGQEFGGALADVLSGVAEPGGRLPITLARDPRDYPALETAPGADGKRVYAEGMAIGYRHFELADVEPEHAFGEGMGYTEFSFEALHARDETPHAVDVTIRNVGVHRGKAVAQVYVAGRPSRLAGFAATTLEPGEVAAVRVELDDRAFSRWDPTSAAWHVDPGTYELRAGSSSRSLPLTARVTVPPRHV
jgi:beta-glucosidase